MPGPSVPGGLRGEAAGAAETPRPGWEATGEEAPRLINGAARPPARPPAACLRLSTRTTRGARLRVWRTVPPTQGEAAGRGALGSRPWRRGGTGALRAWGPMCQCGRGKPGPGAFCRNRAGPTASELTVHAGELPPRPGSAPPWKGKKTKTTLSPARTPTSVAQARPASRGPAGSAPGSVYTDTCLLPLSHYSGIWAREGSPAASRPHTPTARSHRASRRTPPLAKISLETRRRAGAGPRAACHPAARSRQVPLRHPRWQRLRLVLRGHGRRGSGKWEEGRAGPAANLVFYQSTDSFRQAS